MHLLVTGRSGTGKTTVCNALQGVGKPAFDSDRVEGLASWFDLKTHIPIKVDYSRPIDKRTVGWLWAESVLQNFFSQHKTSVLCGSSDNQLDFYSAFDKVIFLSVPADEQIRRIHSRTEHDYGKTPGMTEQILREQAQLLATSRNLGATIMNANRPVHDITVDIIRHLK